MSFRPAPLLLLAFTSTIVCVPARATPPTASGKVRVCPLPETMPAELANLPDGQVRTRLTSAGFALSEKSVADACKVQVS